MLCQKLSSVQLLVISCLFVKSYSLIMQSRSMLGSCRLPMRKLANCRVSFRGIKTSRIKALRSLLENEHDKYGESYTRRPTIPIFTHSDLPEETLYIMDGTSMIFNAYYSREHQSDWQDAFLKPELSADIVKNGDLDETDPELMMLSPEGDNVLSCGALTAMLMTFARFIRDVKPKYLAVAFDHQKRTFRNDLYPLYKQHRSKTPSNLQPQIKIALPLLEVLGCRCYSQIGYEADDVMATLSKWARQRGLNVVHVSVDKDMMQQVDVGVHVMNPRDKKIFSTPEVLEKFGVPPKALCDLQALTGDVADNIPGVKGIGPKTASALLNHFKSLDNLYKKLDKCPAPIPTLEIETPPSSTSSTTSFSDAEEPEKVKPKRTKKVKVLVESENEVKKEVDPETAMLAELEICLTGVRASAVTTLKKLRTCTHTEMMLFQELVTLRDDVHILDLHGPLLESNKSGKEIIDNMMSETKKKKSKNDLQIENSNRINDSNNFEKSISAENDITVNDKIEEAPTKLFPEIAARKFQNLDPGFSTINSSHFLYVGERDGAEEVLVGMSESFFVPLSLLRQQYHKLGRSLGGDLK